MHNRLPNEVDNADCLPDEDEGYSYSKGRIDYRNFLDAVDDTYIEYAYADWSGIARLFPDLELVPG